MDDDDQGGQKDPRTDGERDADRILYSSAFRRLSGVTQVISPQDEYIYHDRAMHSLKVAQVAQRTAQRLNRSWNRELAGVARLDADIIYAAALAHDLGHPPFGHAAEDELQKVLSGRLARDGSPSQGVPILRDSFEGNAQSFRIVARLSARKPDERLSLGSEKDIKVGLNLLWRTYAAILKYPWAKGSQPAHLAYLSNKWGVYDSERAFLERAKECVSPGPGVSAEDIVWLTSGDRSIEAQVMDWADDVAYAVHDTEDFFRAKLIPLDRLSMDRTRTELLYESDADSLDLAAVKGEWPGLVELLKPKVEEVVHRLSLEWDDELYVESCLDLCDLFPQREYHGDSWTREQLHMFASTCIGFLTNGLEIADGVLKVPTRAIIQAEFLKKLTRHYVIDRADLIFDQHGQRGIVRRLFFDLFGLVRALWLDGDATARRAIPSRLREYCEDSTKSYMNVYGTDEAKLARATIDFICSLTDRQAAILSRRLSGDTHPTSMSWVSI